MAEKLKAEVWTSWLKFALIAAFPAYLVFDIAVGQVRQNARQEYRASYCFEFEDEADEAARQQNLPVTVLGKFDHFLKCANLKEVSVLGGKITNDQIIRKKDEIVATQAETLDTITKLQELVEKLNQENAELNALLEARANQDPGFDAPVSNPKIAEQEVAAVLAAAEGTRQTVVDYKQQTEQQIQKLASVAPPKVTPDETWVLIMGAYGDPDNAVREAERLSLLFADLQGTGLTGGSEKVSLLRRRGLLTVVTEYAEGAVARNVLANLRGQLPDAAYVRSLLDICPDAVAAETVQGIASQRCGG